jgi:Transposase IS4
MLRTTFQTYVILGQNVSFNEMMASYSGRSKHTVKMPNKPILEGFKLWALCDRGYLWDFLFYSRTSGKLYIFCDNLFGNPTLFGLLWSLGIGACGTTRRHITKPIFGNIDEWKAS